MADTIIEYVKKNGDYTFKEKPLNHIDSLVFCQFCYLKFDGMVPLVTEKKRFVKIKELEKRKDFNSLFADERFEKDNRALYEAMKAGKRFGNVKMNCYINIIEEEWETQFSAMLFVMDNGESYVAYRGTDETIIGWKEDFNMAFQTPVPGQVYAEKYLNMIEPWILGPCYLGGHSKGGNLSVYAAMHCIPQMREKIVRIYSMDGPGFQKEILEGEKYQAIEGRIIKILPKSSLVGMLFETTNHYKVVDSNTFGLLQHNPFSWLMEQDDFIYMEEIETSTQRRDQALNEWVCSMTAEQRKLFVDSLYKIISASQAADLIEFAADWKKSVTGVMNAMKELDPETKKALKKIIKTLMDILFNRMLRRNSEEKAVKKAK